MSSGVEFAKRALWALALASQVIGNSSAALAGGESNISPHPPAALLRAGEADLMAGMSSSGQRILEVLVARYPETAEAAAARRRLAILYNQSIEPVSLPQVTPAGLPLWRTDAFVVSARQEALRSEAGDRLFFPDGSAALGARAKDVIAAQAAWLSQYPDLVIEVEGHADDRRGAIDQEAVALARAAAVRAALVQAGVEGGRIGIRSFADAAKVAVCDAPECGAQNRRAVVVVSEAPDALQERRERLAARVARR